MMADGAVEISVLTDITKNNNKQRKGNIVPIVNNKHNYG